MKRFLTSIALKLVPEEGLVRDAVKKIYARMYPSRNVDIIHPCFSYEELQRLNSAVKLGFVGDLILLRDMVEAGRKGEDYQFETMFAGLVKYFDECDLMTGVLEGPLSGEKLGYSTANYEDGRVLNCGYPDEFLKCIQKAGIDFLTVATNHLFDKGREGMERTLEIIQSNKVPFVGYGNKSRTLIEIKGFKIAVLAYTYGFNNKKSDFFFQEGNEDFPHIIVNKGNKYYNRCLKQVEDDFKWAKNQNPACILVYPHIGEQFRHVPDKNQMHWFGVFKSLGADIILGCHSHATQPLRFEDDCLCLYCPGNFVNSYFPQDGDASAMVEVYLDKLTGKPFAAGIVPMLAYGKRDKLLQAVPLVDFCNMDGLSHHDWNRAQEAQKTITSSMIGVSIPIDESQKRYIILNDNVYRRLPYDGNVLGVEKGINSFSENLFEDVKTLLFVGDSISEGTKNGGYGWFEPLMASMPDRDVLKIVKGGGYIENVP